MFMTPTNLCLTLQNLSAEQCAEVCSNIKNRFRSIIITIPYLKLLFTELSIEHCTALCKSLRYEVPVIIKTPEELKIILTELPIEKCIALEKCHLQTIIKTPADLSCVLWNLSEKKSALVCTSIKDHLPVIIKTESDLNHLSCGKNLKTAILNSILITLLESSIHERKRKENN